MIQPWWAVGLAVPGLIVKGLVGGRSKAKKEGAHTYSEEDSTDPSFVCERVCTSNRLLRRMGGLAKDPTPGTCVTVCGVGSQDACNEACQRAVCTNLHQPQWRRGDTR
ncbi:hypothetical protein WJX81_003854 [Elliptochloris bilobata]|uniref:Uncharacterized protein n=1 Tax=Elliptochloris bilobata TaxID=381761 RepID=A0AAW1RB52_9CHLO